MRTQLSRLQPVHRVARAQVPGVRAAFARGSSPWRAGLPIVALAWAALLAGCAIPTHPDSAAPPTDPYNPAATQLLDDTQWDLMRWTDANGQARALPQAPDAPLTLNFSTDSGQRKANGFSGCNRYMGTYALKNGKLTFGPLAGTRMACATGAGAPLEQPYLAGLARVEKTGVQMNPPKQLQITLDNGDVMTFTQHGK
jgi:heat shock protein HslJ